MYEPLAFARSATAPAPIPAAPPLLGADVALGSRRELQEEAREVHAPDDSRRRRALGKNRGRVTAGVRETNGGADGTRTRNFRRDRPVL